MVAKNLISNQIAPLDPLDTSEQALTMMHIYHVKHLPIVDDNDNVLTVVSEDDLSQNGMENTLENFSNSSKHYWVYESDHLFDVLAKVAEKKYTTIPVLNKEEKFVGIIEQESLLQYYADSFSFKEPGSIVVLEMKDSAYSLAEIARLIEGEKATILSSFLTKVYGTEKSLVTIKINKKDISKIVPTLERYEYTVKSSFTTEEYMDNFKERYDGLMNYLNV